MPGVSSEGRRVMESEFEALMVEARAALESITRGDPNGYKALYSDADDITLGNPFGGFGRGREAVHEQLDRAASYYRDGATTSFETVAVSVGPDFAYTVEIERFRAKVGGQEHPSDLALRVTCIYHRRTDGWKLVHRHADPRVDLRSAESVIQR
jgi:ketosteroid isomerase-like protein